MNRKIVITILIVLIVGVVGGTVWLVVSRLRSDTGTPSSEPGTLPGSQTGTQNVVNPTGDDDNDGLSNADEALWGTNSTIADTDGDGFSDGDEVANNHNPTIPAPDDTLPVGFVPGRDVQPLDVAPGGEQFESLFDVNVELTPQQNFTEKYENEVPTGDRSQERLIQFVEQQPIITKLPVINPEVVKTVPSSSVALQNYVQTTESLEALQDGAILADGIRELYEQGDPSTLHGLRLRVEKLQAHILEQPVPPEAANLNRLILGYTQLVGATLRQMTNIDGDPVGTLVGVQQLNAIDRTFFPIITQEQNRLQ